MAKHYLTKERHDFLVKDLLELKTEGRRQVAERLKRAKEFGDLSENSEYQEAREQQSYLERRIQELEGVLRGVVIIKKGEEMPTVVAVGSKVTLTRDGKDMVYTIVGSNEAQPSLGFISNESPMGKALLGKGPGDAVTIQTPKGKTGYTVVSIE